MGKRIHPRVQAVVPLRVVGVDIQGKPFRQLAWAVDVSRGGARLVGLPPLKGTGDTIGIVHRGQVHRYTVLRIGRRGTREEGQVSLVRIGGPDWVWDVPPPPEMRDEYGAVPATNPQKAAAQQNLALCLDSLRELTRQIEEQLLAGSADHRLQVAFRQAARLMGEVEVVLRKWATQGQEPYAAIDHLTTMRLGFSLQLIEDIITELEGGGVSVSEEVPDLQAELTRLAARMQRLSGGAAAGS